jgi:hypothetical protein
VWAAIAGSVLDDVALKDPSALLPTRAIEAAVFPEAADGAVGHVEGVVKVIVREESLTPKR